MVGMDPEYWIDFEQRLMQADRPGPGKGWEHYWITELLSAHRPYSFKEIKRKILFFAKTRIYMSNLPEISHISIFDKKSIFSRWFACMDPPKIIENLKILILTNFKAK